MSVPYAVKLLYHSLNDYSMAFETAVPHLFSSNHCATLKYTDNCISARQPSLLLRRICWKYKNFRKYSRSETTPEIVEQTLIFLSRSRKDIMKKLDSFPTHKTGDLEYRAGHVLPYGATPRNDHSHFISELFFYCQISAFFVEIVPDTPFHVAP